MFKDHVDPSEDMRRRRLTTVNYLTATGALAIGLAYAAVPLYRIFCQVKKTKTTVFSNSFHFIIWFAYCIQTIQYYILNNRMSQINKQCSNRISIMIII